MPDQFDVDEMVRIRDDSPVYPGKRATITRLGLGDIHSAQDLDNANSWVVLVEGESHEVEVPERYLEHLAKQKV